MYYIFRWSHGREVWILRAGCLFFFFSAFLDVDCRWHGKGLLRLAEGGEVAAVWKNGKREGKAPIPSPANGIVSLVGEYRCTQDEHHLHNLLD